MNKHVVVLTCSCVVGALMWWGLIKLGAAVYGGF